MKVRIGTDICLHVSLLSNKKNYINIKSVKAYLINTSKEEDMKNFIESEKRTVRYVSRFPIEPDCIDYKSTCHDLCHSGHPTFHVNPVMYTVMPYGGFGVYPHTFDSFYCGNNNRLWNYGIPCEKCIRCGNIQEFYKYCAPVKATEYNNKINVYFPAEDQHYTGSYKLVIVAKIYEPGYGPDNLKTITMDYNEIFTIVGSSEEAIEDSSVELYIGNTTQATSVHVSGNLAIEFGKFTKLVAEVLPAGIDDSAVSWELLDDADGKFSILSISDTSCIIFGNMQEDTSIIYTGTLRVRSRKTPSVYKDVTLILTKDIDFDKFVSSGGYTEIEQDGKKYIRLRMSDGSDVDIDATKETVWYEE